MRERTGRFETGELTTNIAARRGRIAGVLNFGRMETAAQMSPRNDILTASCISIFFSLVPHFSFLARFLFHVGRDVRGGMDEP